MRKRGPHTLKHAMGTQHAGCTPQVRCGQPTHQGGRRRSKPFSWAQKILIVCPRGLLQFLVTLRLPEGVSGSTRSEFQCTCAVFPYGNLPDPQQVTAKPAACTPKLVTNPKKRPKTPSDNQNEEENLQVFNPTQVFCTLWTLCGYPSLKGGGGCKLMSSAQRACAPHRIPEAL